MRRWKRKRNWKLEKKLTDSRRSGSEILRSYAIRLRYCLKKRKNQNNNKNDEIERKKASDRRWQLTAPSY